MSSPETALRSPAREWASARRSWRPPATVPLSEWLDQHYVPSATQGFWKTLPFQRGIADAMSDPELESVSVIKSARVGFTKLLVGYFCYRIATDPCGILAVQPAGEDAEGFSKDDVAPALEATPSVAALVGDPRARDSDNTILHKRFPSGFLKIVGAHSGRGFRRITTDVVAFEEPDAYPPSAGAEGDQIELGKKRAHTAAFPKFISGSSPRLKATSRIQKLWDESDQRDRFLPCPHCDHGQRLRWGGPDVDYGIKFDRDRPREAFYLCEHCHCAIEHHELGRMESQGLWIAGRPEVVGHAGFRIWAAYSPFPAAAWGMLAEEWLRVKDDPLKRQVFINTVLGEPYEERGRSANFSVLMKRREEYPVRVEPATAPGAAPEAVPMVPEGAVLLTSFTDVQLDRVETGVEAWGLGEENWKLEYHVLHGDPTAKPLWEELWELLLRPRHLAAGGVDYIRASGVDSRYAEQSVFAFTARRAIYRTPDKRRAYLWATKGVSGTGPVWPATPMKAGKAGKVPCYSVHVDAAKDMVFARTRATERSKVGERGPGYIHFPTFLGEDWFRQYTAEHARDVTDRRGFPHRVYELKAGHRRNETLDVAVGNYAVLCGLFAIGYRLERLAARQQPRVVEPQPAEAPVVPFAQPATVTDTPTPKKRARRVIRSSWMDR